VPEFRFLLKNALEKRAPLFEETDAFRVVDGAEDDFPGVAIDKYGDHYQIQFFGRELLFREPDLVDAVKSVLSPAFLVTKFRLSPSGKSLEKPEMRVDIGEKSSATAIVREGTSRFQVDLMDTVNPGLFLDMRAGRLDLEKRSRGIEVLNLFSYTCSFGVHARMGGALRAVNVDISGKILDKGRENYRLNGLELKQGEFFKGSSQEYLEWCIKKGNKFGGIVLDPPSFARNKGKVFSVKTDFQTLVEGASQILLPGGFLLASSNFSSFTPKSIAAESLETVRKFFPHARLAWAHGQGIDFPGSGTRKESALSCAMILI